MSCKRQTPPSFPWTMRTQALSMCAVCAGTSHDDLGGAVDPTLQKVYIPVLPICNSCKSQGAKSLVGRYRPNGEAIILRKGWIRRARQMRHRRRRQPVAMRSECGHDDV